MVLCCFAFLFSSSCDYQCEFRCKHDQQGSFPWLLCACVSIATCQLAFHRGYSRWVRYYSFLSLFIHPSVLSFVYSFIHPFLRFVRSFVHSFILLSKRPSVVDSSINPSPPSVCLSEGPSTVRTSVCPSICLIWSFPSDLSLFYSNSLLSPDTIISLISTFLFLGVFVHQITFPLSMIKKCTIITTRPSSTVDWLPLSLSALPQAAFWVIL